MNGTTSRQTATVSRRSGGRRIVRTVGAIALSAGLAGGLALATGAGAMADTASGPSGQSLTVDRAAGLNAAGDAVQVSGAGYDLSKGIYLGVCVNNGPGAVATPCLGGVDTTGGSGSSIWISSNPPAYGQGLAQPFTQSGGKGAFSVTLGVSAADAMTSCEDPATAPNGCVIVSRADHTRGADRSADVMVPISFGALAPAQGGAAAGDAAKGALAKTGASTGLYVAGGVVLLGLGAGAMVLTSRRRSSK